MYLILMLSDEQLLNEYYEFLIANRRKKTADIYLFLLRHYVEYLHSIKKTLHIATSIDIQRYIVTKQEWSNTAKIMFLAIIKNFYLKHYLNKIDIGVTTEELRKRIQRENEIRDITNFPLPHKEQTNKEKSLSLDKLKTLLGYVKKKSLDDYCLIYVLFYFGMRKSELIYINPSNEIFWKDNYLKVTAEKSKTHTERTMCFNDYTKQCLIHILKTYGSKIQLICKDETFLNKVFEKYSKVVNQHIFPHTARHTWITEMQKSLSGKIDIDVISVVKLLAGHNIKSQDMTSYYTNYEPYLKKAMLEYNYLINIY